MTLAFWVCDGLLSPMSLCWDMIEILIIQIIWLRFIRLDHHILWNFLQENLSWFILRKYLLVSRDLSLWRARPEFWRHLSKSRIEAQSELFYHTWFQIFRWSSLLTSPSILNSTAFNPMRICLSLRIRPFFPTLPRRLPLTEKPFLFWNLIRLRRRVYLCHHAISVTLPWITPRSSFLFNFWRPPLPSTDPTFIFP